jgi:CRP-like cAMP-binding protein
MRGDEMYFILEGVVLVHANARILDLPANEKDLPKFLDRHAALNIAEGQFGGPEVRGERIYAKGDVFGEGGLFPQELGLLRRECATALTWASMYSLSAAAMQNVGAEYPEVCIDVVS